LRATEDIHFDIEELLKLYNLYYDRRKGEYRRLRKPISRIVSIKELAQAVIAVALLRPDDARARPMSVLGSEKGYNDVFDVSARRELFLSCILLDRHVIYYLNKRDDISRDEKNDIRFYMDTWLCADLTGSNKATKSQIADLSGVLKSEISIDRMDNVFSKVFALYNHYGANANAAKGGQMTAGLLKVIDATYAPGK
jgi:hypothetical protein